VQLANLVYSLFYFYEILIIVWCLLSWFPRKPGSLVDDISEALGRLVLPYLNLFRRFIPPIGGIDFSPVIAVMVLGVVEEFIVRALI
jgi:YggT family protein